MIKLIENDSYYIQYRLLEHRRYFEKYNFTFRDDYFQEELCFVPHASSLPRY